MNKKYLFPIIAVAILSLFLNFKAPSNSEKIGILSSDSNGFGTSYIRYDNTDALISAAHSGDVDGLVIDAMSYLSHYELLQHYRIVYTIPNDYYFAAFSSDGKTIATENAALLQFIFSLYPDESRFFHPIVFDTMEDTYAALLDESVPSALLSASYAKDAEAKGAVIKSAFTGTGNPNIFLIDIDRVNSAASAATLSAAVQSQFICETPNYDDFTDLILWLYSEETIDKRYSAADLIYETEK
ncbi:MAG: hypothetical protein PWQ12_1250 [Clostridiales bacterium]|jgi:hypothetical protein|nr:hypothetical protein [Clostridiales bacterium]